MCYVPTTASALASADAPEMSELGLIEPLGNILSQLTQGGGAKGINIDAVSACLSLAVCASGGPSQSVHIDCMLRAHHSCQTVASLFVIQTKKNTYRVILNGCQCVLPSCCKASLCPSVAMVHQCASVVLACR